MTPSQQELFDRAVLRVLDANRTRYGLTRAAIGYLLGEFGFVAADGELILDRIDFFVRKGLAEEVTKLVGAANRAWRITEAGIQFVNEQ